MIKSIQQFQEKGIKSLGTAIENFVKDPKDHAGFIYGVTDSVIQLGLNIIAETFEDADQCLRDSSKRKKSWQIVRRDETALLTSLGTVRYKKTLFKNKETGENEYLVDRIMGLESHARMTEDAQARMLEEAVDSSYQKGGARTSLTDSVSRQTVKNKIHRLIFNEAPEELKEKKQVKYLYIDADEDHVSLQHPGKKEDAKKHNTAMPKIIYVYEGIEPEAPKSRRFRLINPRYFGGIYEGSGGVRLLWEEVEAYIEATYDLEVLEKTYINGDGAGWIKRGREHIAGAVFVLDKFHMHKYIMSSTSHLMDSAEDARREIYSAFHRRRKWMAQDVFEKILNVTEEESQRKRTEAGMKYILGNWNGIMQGLTHKERQTGCSAEGHVSHIFADRMSSRPLGWSRTGVHKMAKLRIYKANKGDMLELVRAQKKELKMAAGCEEIICSAEDILLSERSRLSETGKYVETMTHSIPYPQVKKIAYFKNHIWGL